ncbi:RNA polymerase sigma factor [Zavarzinella formosa]|uniref:RNA polymerase sigma factor n=1 Tax=Zavarzinella formosa TaxID=360055 RepID=UPI0003012CEF|nr:RNA polymerase sigma factor [Zavarzinella formosa]
MSTEAEKLLIQQIRAGDERAWERLINLYEGRLLAFAVRRVRDRASAEDIVQEAFIGFLNSVHNFDEKRELQTYLFTITSYKITDHLRRTGRRPAQTGEEAAERMADESDDKQRAASSMARSRERVDLESAIIARSLKQMIDAWRDKEEFARIQVLELIFVKGWANKEVAKFLSITEQQVANYRFAAMKKLSEHVREAGLPGDVFPELAEVK